MIRRTLGRLILQSDFCNLKSCQGLGLDDFAGADAAGAGADLFVGAFHFRLYRAQVDVPAPLGNVVGVADVVAELRPFAADVTYASHNKNLPIVANKIVLISRCE